MDNTDVRAHVLREFYNQEMLSGYGSIDPGKFAERLGVPKRQVEVALKYLVDMGLAKGEYVTGTDVPVTMGITALGMDFVDKTQAIGSKVASRGQDGAIQDERNTFGKEFMRIAIEEARKSQAEDAKPRPKVGVVIAREDKPLARAYRGEIALGEHAEYTALERKLVDSDLQGATVYTTLEPCTKRNHPKSPCVQRIIERRIGRVVIGMLDPNPDIRGRGMWQLDDAGISVGFFDEELKKEIRELNSNFITAQKGQQMPTYQKVTDQLLPLLRKIVTRLQQYEQMGDRRWRWYLPDRQEMYDFGKSYSERLLDIDSTYADVLDGGTRNQVQLLSSQLRQFAVAHNRALDTQTKEEIDENEKAAHYCAKALLSYLESKKEGS